MQLRARRTGFTMIELLVVIAIITLLMAAMFAALSKFRTRTQRGQARNLVEKLSSGLETYHLRFREYPPDTVNGLTGSKALHYWLTTPFRQSPSRPNEVIASIDVGPLVTFQDRETRISGGDNEIVDPWNSPIGFRYDTITDGMGTTFRRPIIYSWGTNKTDDNGRTGIDTPVGDDITPGQ